MPEILQYSNGWAGGVNQSVPAKDIADNELQDARNMLVSLQRTVERRPGVAKLESSNSFGGDITSLYHWRLSDGTEALIATESAKVWRSTDVIPPVTFVDITGAATVSAKKVQWVQFDDALYGAYDTASGTNPIYLADVATNAAAAPVAWPSQPKFLLAAFRRMWWVDAAAPNKLRHSALGDANDHTSTGGAGAGFRLIGDDEDTDIVALWLWRGRIIIFKRNRIYQLVPGTPNTDANQFDLRPFATNIGCVSPWTIQEVLDDLLFLSDSGVASLAATEKYGDYERALVSRNMPKLSEQDKSDPELFSSFNDIERSLYGITYASSSASAGETDEVWTYDYKNPQESLPWMGHDGGLVGASYGRMYISGRPRVVIGGYDGAYWWDEDQNEDDTFTTTYDPGPHYLVTKAYNMDNPGRRKVFYRGLVEFRLDTDPVDYEITYIINQSAVRQKTLTGTFTGIVVGSVLGGPDLLGSTAGSFLMGGTVAQDTDVTFSFRGSAGRRGQTITFRIQNDDWAQRYSVRRLGVDFSVLDSWAHVGDN